MIEEWTYRALKNFWGRVHRWHRKTLHDRILITISRIAFISVIIGACAIDSANWIPIIVMIVLGCTWLLIFIRANNDLL